jgi:hypothetical protein
VFFPRPRVECDVASESHAIEEILGDLERTADRQDHVSVGDVLDALGGRGYGPLLLIPALIEVSPIGGIPGVPTFLALLITAFAAQIAAGREHIWLPAFVQRLRISGDRLNAATKTIEPVAGWLDSRFRGRLERLAGTGARRIAAVICIVLCLTVPALELVPFASTAPMAAIAVFGLAMTFRDGLLMAAAFLVSAAALGTGLWVGLGQ